jgi:hypothetical protein
MPHEIIGGDEFQAAVTVGLAAQACYLMKSSEKAEAVRWVVDTLASCKDSALAELADQYQDMDLLPVLYYYIYGRDAVAARVIVDVYEGIRRDSSETKSHGDDEKEFWCIAGMTEAHKLDEALAATKQFSPEDPRLLLGLHLGAVYVENLHVTTDEERKKARALVKYLDPKIDFMRPTVVKELRSLLLEVQRGQVKAIEMGEGE